MSNRILNSVIVMSAVSSFLLSIVAITLLVQGNIAREAASVRAVKERQQLKEQNTIDKKQNDLIICFLQVQPGNRTSEALQTCRQNTVDKRDS